jgi:hypothetical protein
MTNPMTIDEIRNASPYDLADMADCDCPDNRESSGAAMLACVRDSVVKAIQDGSITLDDFDDRGQLHEIADGAPSVYTHTIWRTFVDLAAYQEENEFGDEWPNDLTKAASLALYQISNRLAHALCEAWRAGWECPVCSNPRGDYDCSPEDCRAWQCPECDGYDNTHGCQIDQCKAPQAHAEPLPVRTPGLAMAEVGMPASDVYTGPVDLAPVHDPILSLIDRAEATDMGIRVARRARIADAAVSRFRRKVWTAVVILAAVSVPLVLWVGGAW